MLVCGCREGVWSFRVFGGPAGADVTGPRLCNWEAGPCRCRLVRG